MGRGKNSVHEMIASRANNTKVQVTKQHRIRFKKILKMLDLLNTINPAFR